MEVLPMYTIDRYVLLMFAKVLVVSFIIIAGAIVLLRQMQA